MTIKGCKTIAEYAFRRWMAENEFAEGYFSLEINGNEAVIKDLAGDTLKLVYDDATKSVHVQREA